MNEALSFIFAVWLTVAAIIVWIVGIMGTLYWAERTWVFMNEDLILFLAVCLLLVPAWPLVLLAMSGTVAGRAFARWLP